MEKSFSIIIPIKNFTEYLKESIPIMLDLDYKNFEIILLPNEDQEIPKHLKNKKIRIISTGKVSPAIKRDIGAKEAKGEYVAFIDDDAYPNKDWLKIAERLFIEKKVAAIGGPGITPDTDKFTAKASGLVYETLFGMGGYSYRYKPDKKSFYVEDFPSVNLIFERKVFLEIGGFASEFWPGEDTKLCLELIKKGYKIWYSNKLIVHHHRRPGIMKHLNQVATYGKHRGYFAKVYPETSRKIQYFVPSIFLLGNLSLFVLALFNLLFLYIWIDLLIFYFILVIIDVFLRTSKILIGSLTVILVFLTHLWYGAGFINGLLTKNLKSKLR